MSTERRSEVWFVACLITRAFIIWAISYTALSVHAEALAVFVLMTTAHFLWRHSRHYPKPYPRRTKGTGQ